jgi:hypothetical protein
MSDTIDSLRAEVERLTREVAHRICETCRATPGAVERTEHALAKYRAALDAARAERDRLRAGLLAVHLVFGDAIEDQHEGDDAALIECVTGSARGVVEDMQAEFAEAARLRGAVEAALLVELTAPCGHAEPQDASQLHGVCVFCWRDRASMVTRRLRAALASSSGGVEAPSSARDFPGCSIHGDEHGDGPCPDLAPSPAAPVGVDDDATHAAECCEHGCERCERIEAGYRAAFAPTPPPSTTPAGDE